MTAEQCLKRLEVFAIFNSTRPKLVAHSQCEWPEWDILQNTILLKKNKQKNNKKKKKKKNKKKKTNKQKKTKNKNKQQQQ